MLLLGVFHGKFGCSARLQDFLTEKSKAGKAHPKPSPLEKVPSAARRMWSPRRSGVISWPEMNLVSNALFWGPQKNKERIHSLLFCRLPW